MSATESPARAPEADLATQRSRFLRERAARRKAEESLAVKAARARFLEEKQRNQAEARQAFRAWIERQLLERKTKIIEKEGWRAALKELGFDSYADYLKSSLWRSIRQRVIRGRRGRCFFCGDFAREVHHRKYSRDNLAGKSLSGLLAVCRPCHCRQHGLPIRPPKTRT